MSVEIVNAAPMVVDRGTQDLSIEQLARLLEQIPQHLPKFFIRAQKGSTDPELVGGVDRVMMYGSKTFDPNSKYFNHQTLFANKVNEFGNLCMLQRLIPEDAGPNATIVFWLDVLETLVDDYERNTDGSIKRDATTGDPIILGQVAGFRVKFVQTYHDTVTALQNNFGQLTQQPGNQTDGSNTSIRYPIFELKYNSQGEAGNMSGIRMWAPTVKTVQSMPVKMMDEQRAYPYFMSVIRKDEPLASPKVVKTLMDEQQIMVTFKEDVVDPLTSMRLNFQETFVNSYQNIEDLRYAKVYGDFGELKVYQANLEELLERFHAAEVPFIGAFSDFTSAPEDLHLFNFLQGQSSQGVPYHSYVFVDDVDSVQFGQHNNFFAAGGSDGSMDVETYEAQVRQQLGRYLDPSDEVQDLAYHVESIFYDSGFSMQTKLEIPCFISNRKDTFAVISTHTDGERELTQSEQLAAGISIRTRVRSFPESEYFGTETMRCMIMTGSAKIRNSLWKKPVGVAYEVALKSARYMGASNGAWKNGANFDDAQNGGSILEELYNPNIVWVPKSVRNRLWDVGLNWVHRFDRRQFSFPALKTVTANDTSVLNSYFTAMCIAQLNKVAHLAWRTFSGNSSLTNAQLADRVNDFVNANVKDRFDNRFIIRPQAYFTEMDTKRGFSWTLPIQIGAPGMRTVMTTYVQAYRYDTLAAQ